MHWNGFWPGLCTRKGGLTTGLDLTKHPVVGKGDEIRVIASRQRGAFNRTQATQCGFNREQIALRVRRGEWIQLDGNVFAIGGSVPDWHQRLSASVLSRPVAYVAGRSAAHLHGFPGYPRSRPEILVPFAGNARSPLARVIRSRLFDQVAVEKVSGLPTTSVAETILTLSFREPTSVIARLVDDQIAARRLVIPMFDPILDRLEGARVRGLPGLRRIVAERDSDAYKPPTSELERLLYIILDDPRLPGYTRQAPFHFPERSSTVDAFIEDWAMIVEGDSRRWHTRVQDFEIDRIRGNAAAAAGYITIRFTYSMLVNDPSGCLDTLLRAGRFRKSA